jgi:hypothetical protein
MVGDTAPSHELIAKSIEMVEREVPEVWSRVIDYELGKRAIMTRPEYYELWRPIATLLFNAGVCEKNASKLSFLEVHMRFELRRRLGLPDFGMSLSLAGTTKVVVTPLDQIFFHDRFFARKGRV